MNAGGNPSGFGSGCHSSRNSHPPRPQSNGNPMHQRSTPMETPRLPRKSASGANHNRSQDGASLPSGPHGTSLPHPLRLTVPTIARSGAASVFPAPPLCTAARASQRFPPPVAAGPYSCSMGAAQWLVASSEAATASSRIPLAVSNVIRPPGTRCTEWAGWDGLIKVADALAWPPFHFFHIPIR